VAAIKRFPEQTVQDQTMTKIKLTVIAVALTLAGCSSTSNKSERDALAARIGNEVETTPDATSTATTMNGYRAALANRIAQVSSTQVFVGRPQALLRSVVVVKYAVDANGKLLRSEVLRSNHDRTTEGTALSTLRAAAPFPRPAPALLRQGKVELMETWLFNEDGRFQLRTIAEPQMGE
jgi:protein TonB